MVTDRTRRRQATNPAEYEENLEKKQPKTSKIATVLGYILIFASIFSITFFVLWYTSEHRAIKHCQIETPLDSEMPLYPEFNQFYKEYSQKFNIAYHQSGTKFSQ